MPENPSIKIAVAAHKPYWMPQDPMYIPVQVGAEGKDNIPGYQPDNQGENISEKNPRYCELTALYWAWKNLDADYVGLAHYRRHFAGSGEKKTLTNEEAEVLTLKAPVILPKKRHYYIETIGNHYAHTFDGAQLDIVRDVLAEKSHETLTHFEQHLNKRCAHIWNMAIMRRDILDSWCSWLFPILEEVENRINFEDMTPFEARCIGRLSERLLDPWIEQQEIAFVEQPASSTEPTNWLKKGSSFLGAKLFGKKYDKSF